LVLDPVDMWRLLELLNLGKKVAIIEKEHLGGVCLNKGCIPTKAVLKSAHSVHEIADFKDLGINVDLKVWMALKR
jgi:pyruvate/2-oxoglutarate dehydrogenase complex dihydrolipoamide dehydrogenase (E3) component